MMNHLWYLNGELVPLCLFSKQVADETKRLIVAQLKIQKDDWKERHIRDHLDLENKELYDLIKPSSYSALRSLRLRMGFLFEADPTEWATLPEYVEAKLYVDSIKVVNDTAERSLGLMSHFNESVTKNETEMQRLIQVVENNRKKIPNAKKKTLIGLKKHDI